MLTVLLPVLCRNSITLIFGREQSRQQVCRLCTDHSVQDAIFKASCYLFYLPHHDSPAKFTTSLTSPSSIVCPCTLFSASAASTITGSQLSVLISNVSSEELSQKSFQCSRCNPYTEYHRRGYHLHAESSICVD